MKKIPLTDSHQNTPTTPTNTLSISEYYTKRLYDEFMEKIQQKGRRTGKTMAVFDFIEKLTVQKD